MLHKKQNITYHKRRVGGISLTQGYGLKRTNDLKVD